MNSIKRLIASIKDGVARARIERPKKRCASELHRNSPFVLLRKQEHPHHRNTDEDFLIVTFYKRCELCECEYTEERATLKGGVKAFLARGA